VKTHAQYARHGGSATGAPSLAAGVPLLRISCDQVALDQAAHNCITGLTVSLAANQQASFTLELNDPGFGLIEREQGPLGEGQALDIALRNSDMELVTVIAGTVSAIGIELDGEDGLSMMVEGHDALSAAAAGSNYVRYLDQWSDLRILQAIADRLRLNLSVDSATRQAMSAEQARARHQVGQSDFAFIVALAEEYGCDFWVGASVLNFRREMSGGKIRLQRGVNLSNISLRLSTAGQVIAVEATAWNTQGAQAIAARAQTIDRKGYWERLSQASRAMLREAAPVQSIVVRDLTEANRRAEAQLRSMARNLITAEGSMAGNPELRVGSVVELGNMGRFDGEYLVQSVRHSIGADGFQTSFSLCLHI
jgi:phage protein D